MCKYARGSIKTASDMKAESTLCLGSLALLYRSTCASNPWMFFDVATARVSIFPLGSGTVSWMVGSLCSPTWGGCYGKNLSI